MEWRTDSVDDPATAALGARLGRVLAALAVPAFVVDLRGELGAGKTVFVRGLGRALGVPPAVPIVSPTFTIARAYALAGPALRELHHLDAYRLDGLEALEAAGFEEMCGDGRLTCVEWGGQVEDALPEDRLIVTLEHRALDADAAAAVDPHAAGRRLRFRATGPRAARVLAALRAEPAAAGPEA